MFMTLTINKCDVRYSEDLFLERFFYGLKNYFINNNFTLFQSIISWTAYHSFIYDFSRHDRVDTQSLDIDMSELMIFAPTKG